MPMMSLKDAYENAKQLLDAGHYRVAARSAEILYKQTPYHPPVIALYVNALLRIQQHDLALRIAKRALRNISHKPHRVMIITHLVDTMTQAGQLDDAIEMVRDELASQPDNEALAAAMAHALVMGDRHEEAVELIEDCRQRGVESLNLAAVLGRALLRTDRRDEVIEYIEHLLDEQGEESNAGKHQVYNTLGQLYDNAKRYDEAMDAYQMSNAVVKPDFDERRLENTLESIRQSWTPERFAKATRPEPAGPRPVFIVGMPRSGTTLTEQIIDAHPRGFGAGELGLISDLFRELAIDPDNSYATGPEEYDTQALADAAQEYRQRLRELAGDRDVDVIVDKAPLNCNYVGLIALMFPDAHIIHCRRDPRDNCLSCFFQLLSTGHSYSFDLYNCGRYYRNYRQIMKHYESLLSSPEVNMPIFENDYEGMVANQEQRTHELLEFIGLPFDPACLEFYKTGRVAVTLSNDQVRQPIYKSSTKRYERYAAHLGPLIEGLGEEIINEADSK
ncbi:MAG: tetratricopeptide repeat-containing sulfotransferase family protein [Phycisphaerales bacterium JB052]